LCSRFKSEIWASVDTPAIETLNTLMNIENIHRVYHLRIMRTLMSYVFLP
jgi:hypothetical protein